MIPLGALRALPWRLIGTGLVITLLLGWALRLDHLRAHWRTIALGHEQTLSTIRIAFEDMGEPVPADADIEPAVRRAFRQREDERAANAIMAGSVKRAGEETQRAQAETEEAQRRIAKLTKERDTWIAKARSASTRTERMTAELELAECVSALSELRASGF